MFLPLTAKSVKCKVSEGQMNPTTRHTAVNAAVASLITERYFIAVLSSAAN